MEESEPRDIERMRPEEGAMEESGEKPQSSEDEAQEREDEMEEEGGELPG